MKIDNIRILDGRIEVRSPSINGEPLTLLYSGEVDYQLVIRADQSVSITVTVAPSAHSSERAPRRANRTMFDR